MMFVYNSDIDKLYLAIHRTGFGEQGGEPIRYREIVYSSDDLEELTRTCDALYPKDPSGWTYDNYVVAINTALEEGQRLKIESDKEQKIRFAELDRKMKEHPENYHTVECGGYTIHLEKNDEFDKPTQFPDRMNSFKLIFLGDDPI
jgi:hypothetical protein